MKIYNYDENAVLCLCISKNIIDTRNGYAEYHRNPNALAKLKDDDFALIACCLRKNSIEQMAEAFGLTRSGINKRLAALYDKFGVKSKNEMLKIFYSSMLDWTKI